MISKQTPNILISYHRMRMIVGILGFSLPFALVILNTIINHFDLINNDYLVQNCANIYQSTENIKPSISDYYYSAVGELFVGTLCAVSFFMFCYRGYPKKAGEFWPSDNFMVNTAGICAIGVAIFPTSANCNSDNLRTFVSSPQISWMHYLFATLFFISLAIISLVNFRRTQTIELFGKMPSHNFYKTCGIGILICISILGIYSFTNLKNNPSLQNIPVVFIFETFALLFFGASWIKKGMIDSD